MVLMGILATAQSQVKVPAPSPAQTLKQEFGLGFVEVSYSRPALKGRTIYKDIAPAGKLWRTGANSPTTIEFTDEVTIGGKKIPAGKYGLLAIPAKNSWTVIISKQTNIGSNLADYKATEDLVRVTTKPQTIANSTENFTIQLNNITPNTANLQLAWGSQLVVVPMTVDIDGRIMASIDASMQTEKPAYFAAASYYFENNKDLNKALEWFSKAILAQPNAFWIQYQYAKALAKAGKKQDAKTAAEKSKALALTAQNDDYVRMNDALLSSLK